MVAALFATPGMHLETRNNCDAFNYRPIFWPALSTADREPAHWTTGPKLNLKRFDEISNPTRQNPNRPGDYLS
jgi:hypothetical protein